MAYLTGAFVVGFAVSSSGAKTGTGAAGEPSSRASSPANTAAPAPSGVSVALASLEPRADQHAPARSSEPSPEEVRAANAAHAGRLLQSLYDHTNQLKAQAPPGTAPEAIANQAVAFLTGWVDALRFTSAEVLDAVGDAVRAHVCASDQSSEETLVSAYVLQWVPEIASGAAFDCFLQDPRRRDTEDVELWAMLDAWRNSGLEPPGALAALKRTAHDPRTLRRFTAPGSDPQRERSIAQAPAGAGRTATTDPSAH